MYKVYKLSDVWEGFKGRVVTVVNTSGYTYRYYNMGFYPGNSIIVLYKGERKSIMRLGRKIVEVSNDILDKVLVVEDKDLVFVDWS